MPTFIVASNDAFDAGVTLNPDDERHLLRVMRASSGDEFRVTNLRGKIARVAITKLKPLECRVIEVLSAAKPASITVCLALIEQQYLEWAIEKLTELNIERVRLIACARSQKRDLSAEKIRRLTRVTSEALKQCGRGWPLIIGTPMPFDEALAQPAAMRIFGALAGASDLQKIQNGFHKNGGEIWIGPEGGFTVEEEQKLARNGSQAVRLGHTILRAETAAVALAALVVGQTDQSSAR